jgi:hypothetical protein
MDSEDATLKGGATKAPSTARTAHHYGALQASAEVVLRLGVLLESNKDSERFFAPKSALTLRLPSALRASRVNRMTRWR